MSDKPPIVGFKFEEYQEPTPPPPPVPIHADEELNRGGAIFWVFVMAIIVVSVVICQLTVSYLRVRP